jgi:sulfur relay (sulfurtransferase) DsrF/TusC family protein
VENVQYPADWLADGGPPFESLGLRQLLGSLSDYAAITLIRDNGVWKVVAGESNTVLAEADYENIMEYLATYAWHLEHAEQQAARS